MLGGEPSGKKPESQECQLSDGTYGSCTKLKESFKYSIIIHSLHAVLPVVLIWSLLVSCVLRRRAEPEDDYTRNQTQKGYIFVKTKPNRPQLLLGLLIPALSNGHFSVMALISYTTSKIWLTKPKMRPTPLQYAVILTILNAQVFWGVLLYIIYWKDGRYFGRVCHALINRRGSDNLVTLPARFVHVIGGVVISLAILHLLIYIFSLQIHLQTKVEQYPSKLYTPTNTRSSYGRKLMHSCYKLSSKSDPPCSVVARDTGYHMLNPAETLQILHDQSPNHKIEKYEDYVYLASPSISPGTGYEAVSYGVKTECESVSRACSSWGKGDSQTVDRCPYPIFRNLSSEKGVLISNDSNGRRSADNIVSRNPFYFAVRTNIHQLQGIEETPVELFKDPEVVLDTSNPSILLWCTTSIAHITLRMGAKNEVELFEPELANGTLGEIVSAPIWANCAQSELEEVVRVLSIMSNNAESFTKNWAFYFSQTALALTAGTMEPDRNLAEWKIEEKTGFCFNRLFLKITSGLICFYVIIVLIIARVAWCSAKIAGVPQLQKRTSIVGAVAEAFEGLGNKGVEYRRGEAAQRKDEDGTLKWPKNEADDIRHVFEERRESRRAREIQVEVDEHSSHLSMKCVALE